jgi:uncharacterized protein (DUF362 family)
VRPLARREVLGLTAGLAGAALGVPAAGGEARARVALVRAEDRREGLRRVLALLGADGVRGRSVVLKPNLNSADPYPASTHPDTLAGLVDWLGAAGARGVTVVDRSGMGVTREVMEATGVRALGRRLGFATVALDDLPARDWVPAALPGSHWRRGVLLPRLVAEAEAVVNTCCLKTHRFGGHVTLSLKNGVGLVARHGPDGHDYMRELHGSPAQRSMIAELNLAYRPALVLLDGLEAFVTGGPEAGTRAAPGVLVAGTDRVAVDAVGVALLRLHGTTREVAAGPVFGQEQVARAAALGLGVARPDLVDLVTDDAAGEAVLGRLRPLLRAA